MSDIKVMVIDLSQNSAAVTEKKKITLSHHDEELYTFLSKSDANFSKIDDAGWTPMHRAIKIDNIEIVRILILKCNSVDLNFTNQNGNTPLTFAIARGNLKVIELLLKSGADPNFEDCCNKGFP